MRKFETLNPYSSLIGRIELVTKRKQKQLKLPLLVLQ